MLQVLLRITEAVMKRPQENQRKDSFAESLAAILFRVCIWMLRFYIDTDIRYCIHMRKRRRERVWICHHGSVYFYSSTL